MKHIQKDYNVKMYIPRESANQNVAFVGERNDERHAVPSVMKLLEELTDEKVDEMILETHSALSRSWTYQFFRSQKESWKLSQHSTGENPTTSHYTDRPHVRTHTQGGGEDRQRFSISRSKLRTHRMRRLSQGTTQQ